MLISPTSTRILSIVFNLLLLKNVVKGQNSPCPNNFYYHNNGNNLEGIATLPALNGVNNLEVQIVLVGDYNKSEQVVIDFADEEKVARKSFKDGGNIRYKISFPTGLSITPAILSITLNDQQFCDNQNALLFNEPYVVLGVKFNVDPGTSPTQSTPLTQSTPSLQLRPFRKPTPLQDNILLDLVSLPPPTPSTSRPSTTPATSIFDRDWLQTFSSNQQCGTHFSATHTIINGRELVPNEFPWLVALFDHNRAYFCGGSLISDKHVVTAAHCCVQQTWIFLELGKHVLSDRKEAGAAFRVSQKIINHPDYKPNTGHADISIIIISEKVIFSDKIKPICLWPYLMHDVGDQGTVAGWGNDISGTSTDIPMSADVNIVSDQECLNSNKLFATITSNSTFCAGGKNKGPCQGDSGAGFIINKNNRWYLKGIISISLSNNPRAGLCDVTKFAVYCDVADYIGWLQQYLI